MMKCMISAMLVNMNLALDTESTLTSNHNNPTFNPNP